jgi:hypothetical protein
MSILAEQIEKYTAEISGFETKRDYISLSHAVQPKEDLLKMYLDGFIDGHLIRLRCYKGYQMERDLVTRVKHVLGAADHPEISAHNGIVRGHPDFIIEGCPGDCKSVPMDEHLPTDTFKLPRRVYWQAQAYMWYVSARKALIIYESRESGLIRDFWVQPNSNVQREIYEKYLWCVRQIKERAA